MGNTCTGSNKILPFHAGGSANLILLGLNNAGKSTLLARLRQEESTTDTVPTVGVAPLSHLYYRGKAVTIQDVAGAAKYRGSWHTLFPEVHGIVFVVDSTDHERLAEARRELHTAVMAEQCIGKPILILANKQDQAGALRPKDIATELELDNITTAQFERGDGFAPPAPAPVSVGGASPATLESGSSVPVGVASPAPARVSDSVVQTTTLDAPDTTVGAAGRPPAEPGTVTASGVVPGVPDTVAE